MNELKNNIESNNSINGTQSSTSDLAPVMVYANELGSKDRIVAHITETMMAIAQTSLQDGDDYKYIQAALQILNHFRTFPEKPVTDGNDKARDIADELTETAIELALCPLADTYYADIANAVHLLDEMRIAILRSLDK